MISGKITVLEGDITQLQVDAIINAANTPLLGAMV
jgi:O-acetyl-ADP-ribose deacetylase (regulator of RNase III)